MKVTLNLYTKLIILFIGCFILSNCEGDMGPEGLQGQTGPQGLEGPQGQPGNANVKIYNLEGFSHYGMEVNKEIDQNSEEFEKSLIYVYAKASNFWYPLPGRVTNAFEYRIFFGNDTVKTTIYMNRVFGNGEQIIQNLKVYVVEASNVISAKSSEKQSSRIVKTIDGRIYTDEELLKMTHAEFCSALNIPTH